MVLPTIVINTAMIIIIVIVIVIIEVTVNIILNEYYSSYLIMYTQYSSYFIIPRPSYTMFNVSSVTTKQR